MRKANEDAKFIAELLRMHQEAPRANFAVMYVEPKGLDVIMARRVDLTLLRVRRRVRYRRWWWLLRHRLGTLGA
jgi:hypothetical protein